MWQSKVLRHGVKPGKPPNVTKVDVARSWLGLQSWRPNNQSYIFYILAKIQPNKPLYNPPFFGGIHEIPSQAPVHPFSS